MMTRTQLANKQRRHMIYTQRIYIALAFIVISRGLLRWKPKLKWPVMLVYAAAVVYRSARYLLDPFHAWRYVIRVTEKGLVLGSKSQLKVIVLNILLFVPFGYLLPLFRKRADRWWKVLLCGFAASLTIELLQLVTRYGMFDLDDLMHNTLGALLGWGCYAGWLAGSCR